MRIRYFGHSCFEITAKTGIKIITDPYQGVGYEMPQGLCADIVTCSHGHFDHNFVEGVKAETVVNAIGEFSIDGMKICGIASYHDEKKGALRGKNIIYKFIVDGLTVCHMGDIGEPCSVEMVNKIGKIDLLLLPVGGTYTVDAVGALEYVNALMPKAVIPMHYKPKDGSLDITDAKPFLEVMSSSKIQTVLGGVVEIDENAQGVVYMERVK